MADKDKFNPIKIAITGGDEQTRNFVADAVTRSLQTERIPVVPPKGLVKFQSDQEEARRQRDRFDHRDYRSMADVIRSQRPELFENALIVTSEDWVKVDKRIEETEAKQSNAVAILIVGDDPAVNSAVANAVRLGVQQAGFWDHRPMNNYRDGDAFFDNRAHPQYENNKFHKKAVRSLLTELEETRPELFNTRVLIDCIEGNVLAKSERITHEYASIYIGNNNALYAGLDFNPDQRNSSVSGIVYVEDTSAGVPGAVHVDIEA